MQNGTGDKPTLNYAPGRARRGLNGWAILGLALLVGGGLVFVAYGAIFAALGQLLGRSQNARPVVVVFVAIGIAVVMLSVIGMAVYGRRKRGK